MIEPTQPSIFAKGPDGCQVPEELACGHPTMGVREEYWPNTSEEIAAFVKEMAQVESVTMTPEEEAEWHAARQAQKEYEKARFEEYADYLRSMWD